MHEIDQVIRQAAVVAALVKRHKGIGRTALMKYVYLLQTVRGQPLGFDFSLYAYGPYDGAVLSRLATAVRWKAVNEQPIMYPSGLGYDLEEGLELQALLDRDREFLAGMEQDLDWVVENFRMHGAAAMELLGTMVFADREAKEEGLKKTKQELIELVLRIKPRFSKEQAEEIYDKLKGMGALVAATE